MSFLLVESFSVLNFFVDRNTHKSIHNNNLYFFWLTKTVFFESLFQSSKQINNYNYSFFAAGAMQAMVSKGIVHRDLKPQNILLAHDGRTKNPQPQDITLKIGEMTFP